ncbi:MAG: hypothetical protein VX988_05270 [Planctomycetota bacterium]|nr:hypothetical protein [Planctomycetota bacterium]
MNSIMPVSADKAADKTVAPSSLPPPERPPVLQFRLRTMLLVVACLSAAMASIHWLGLLWSSALIFVAVLAAAHVAGNSIGTQLRDRGSLYGRSPPEPPPALPPPVPGDLATPPLGKSTPLSHTAALTTLIGIVAGAVAGWLAFGIVDRGQLAAGDWAIGVASCAALGGFWSFLGAGFFQIGCWPAVRCALRCSGTDPGEQTKTESTA